MTANSERKAVDLYRLFGVCTPEQAKAISEIDEIMLDLVLLSLNTNDMKAIRKSASPFETFELGVPICETLGLSAGTWVPVHFHGPVPVIAWDDEELRTLQGKSVAELKGIVAALRRYRGHSGLVTLI